jgi:hypothetical protein
MRVGESESKETLILTLPHPRLKRYEKNDVKNIPTDPNNEGDETTID